MPREGTSRDNLKGVLLLGKAHLSNMLAMERTLPAFLENRLSDTLSTQSESLQGT